MNFETLRFRFAVVSADNATIAGDVTIKPAPRITMRLLRMESYLKCGIR